MIELRLIHDGEFWRAENECIVAKGETLQDLDCELGEILHKSEEYRDNKQLTIRMTFDNSTIPEWIRQYSNHYFNRIVTIALAEE